MQHPNMIKNILICYKQEKWNSYFEEKSCRSALFLFFDLSEFSENDIPSSPNIIEMRFSKKKKGRDE
jgi:hypothetical protein